MSRQDEFIAEIKRSLNQDQQTVFEECIHGHGSVFCTGQGGTGKSWLLECIVRYYREFPLQQNKLLAVTASTGIAAFLIKGMTLHRFAGVGIEETNIGAMIQRASRGASKTYWTTTSILIIDEISMISATFFENLSLVAQNLRSSNEAFGGIRLIMFGDFLQLPPISKIDHSSTRVFHTDAWHELDPKVMELRQMVRQSDPEFIRILSEIRYGVCSDEAEHYIQQLDREVSYSDGIEAVKLFAKKNTTEAYNESMLQILDTEIVNYRSVDTGDASSLRQCPAPQILKLKKGSQVMVIRNISNNIVNGSVGTVTGFEMHPSSFIKKPKVMLVMPDGTSSTIIIGRVTWETIAPNGRVIASRVQFPLILAWAVTIHKSQGQTMPRVTVDMSGVFETGQAYVAMSRCTSPTNLRVLNFNKHLVMAAPSCVTFYHQLNAASDSSDLPVYVDERQQDNPPEYSEDSATDVAEATEQAWDRTTVHNPLVQDPLVDIPSMLEGLTLQETQDPILSLQENSNSSQLNSEN
jgi:ATP-dependent DNA helicase PIF1